MKFYLDNIKSSKITPSKKRTNRATPIKLLLACVGVVIAGIIIAIAKLGADNAQMVLGIPKVVTGIFEGMLLFFLLAGETIQKYKISIRKDN